MKYIQRKDGEGFTVKNRVPFRLACCDCGLVHDFALAVEGVRKGAEVGLAAKRNNRATAARRRQSKRARNG
jgi:hypothetical protein